MLLVPFYNPWKHQKHQKTFGEGQFFKRAFIDTFFPGEKKLFLLKTRSINQLILGDADHYKNMHSALTVFILKVKLSHTNLNYNLVYHDMEKHLSLFCGELIWSICDDTKKINWQKNTIFNGRIVWSFFLLLKKWG